MVGRLKKVPLREVWKNEAKDFTEWLAKNIEALGEDLDLELSVVKKESGVGPFAADLVAEDAAGQRVVIENQLEKTDHDHLGKLVTYVSNLDAKVAIWIASKPRPEHEKAIGWLNESASDIDFYLLKVEAYKIGDSEPAPKFSIISGPSEESKRVGKEKQEFAQRHKLRMEFWRTLLERSKAKTSLHANISPGVYSWVGTGAGRGGLGYNYAVTYKGGKVELYIDRGKGSKRENKKIFDQLYSKKTEIEKVFGGKLEWQRLDDRRACRIMKTIPYAGLGDKEKWPKLQDDMINAMINLEKALKDHIANLKLRKV